MKPLRKIEPGGYQSTQFAAEDIGADVITWLVTQAEHYGLTRLLAHADDGVIWGRKTDEGTMVTSHDAFGEPPSPKLRLETLQQARLFGEGAELLLWRTAKGWQARLAKDAPQGEHYDQSQMLWGDRRVDGRDGFTLVEEGRQGLRHAPPVKVPEGAFSDERHPLYLQVRHYLATDPETGVVDVALSRLVSVGFETEEVAS